ncbi:MAG: cell division protein ZapE [Steroidobacteraceae bacterium]
MQKTPKSSVLAGLYAAEAAKRGFRGDPAQLAALVPLERLRRTLSTPRPRSITSRLSTLLGHGPGIATPRGVYLWGDVGRGKTWLMDLFYSSLKFAERRRSHFYRFMHDVHAELQTLKGESAPLDLLAARIAATTRVLCFDELFVSDIGDAMILGGLFDGLIRHGVALVFTSNVPPQGLYQDGLQRQRFLPAIALLEKHTEVIHLEGPFDYRLTQLARAQLYLPSADPATSTMLAELFDDLSDDDEDTDGFVEIGNRKIAVLRESENVVWFEFAALCEGPRGPSDYIHLAREYQSVLISNVPVFDSTDENAARRFITLVDEFYDRGVNLILSAAAPPQRLYTGDRLKFEFARTASRLIEMQSRAYLARQHVAN